MNSSDKPAWKSKKWTMGLAGILAVLAITMFGADATAYGAIGLIVSVACGGQAAVDWKNQGR